jgi:hypothetical protein
VEVQFFFVGQKNLRCGCGWHRFRSWGRHRYASPRCAFGPHGKYARWLSPSDPVTSSLSVRDVVCRYYSVSEDSKNRVTNRFGLLSLVQPLVCIWSSSSNHWSARTQPQVIDLDGIYVFHLVLKPVVVLCPRVVADHTSSWPITDCRP